MSDPREPGAPEPSLRLVAWLALLLLLLLPATWKAGRDRDRIEEALESKAAAKYPLRA